MLKGILPAVKNLGQFEKLLGSEHKQIILLETRISQIAQIVRYAKKENKNVLVHADLVQGMKADSYGIEFLVREVKVDGIISTRGSVITLAKKYDVMAIQRLFVLDSHALDHNLKMINKIKPDYIEVLPGVIPNIIQEVSEYTGLPVIAGGLIRTKEDAQIALENGAQAVSTSNTDLWGI